MKTASVVPTIPRPKSAFFKRVVKFALICIQLKLILVVVDSFGIEKRSDEFNPLLGMLNLAAFAFAIHAWLPLRFRASFFALVSLASIVLFLGWSNGFKLIGIGLGLIAVWHLPVRRYIRVIILLFAGIQVAALRLEYPEPFWPVLASMFMFRLIVYAYETRKDATRAPFAHILAYFFALPNICFLLFPVIDFKTFCRTYYDEDDYRIYKTGISWMVRGLSHLILYRFIKYYVLPAPHQLGDLPHLILFLAANYALYLHVSGWFHLITGLLHLFGFNLPRTHLNYFLASSVGDVWRRINIYWKDFMAKVFFYPAFLALHRLGTPFAMAAAVMVVFVVTWLLHSYQVFWLRGELPLSWNEAALWLSAGVLVSINLLLELRQSSRKAALPRALRAGWFQSEAVAGALLGLRIARTFLLVSLFWGCWTIPKFPIYLRVAATSGTIRPKDLLIVVGCMAIIGVAGALTRLARGWLSRRGMPALAVSVLQSGAVPIAVLLVLIASSVPDVGAVLGPEPAGMLANLRQESASPLEAAVVVQGYYEEIAVKAVQASPLLALPGLPKKQEAPPDYSSIIRPADDFLEHELIPGWSGDINGTHLSINSLGMRDREGITKEKPADTCRLAFVGSSVVMGYGVGDDETLCRVLEARMNAERPEKARHVEILNFGVGLSNAINRQTLIGRRVLVFKPDAIYYFAHQDEYTGTVRHVATLVARKNALPAYLNDILRRAGVEPETPPGEIEIRLERFAPEILRGIYADIVGQCRLNDALPVWVYLRVPTVVSAPTQSEKLTALAKEAGFIAINLNDWAEGHSFKKIMADDAHPNASGQRLIAERLSAALRATPYSLPACALP